LISIKAVSQTFGQGGRIGRERDRHLPAKAAGMSQQIGSVLQMAIMQEKQSLEVIYGAADYFGRLPVDPVAGLDKAHRAQLVLCDLLEHIADTIPGDVNHQTCLALAEQLGPLICSIHRFEEEMLFPLTMVHAETPSRVAETVKRLKHEHFEDECFAEELADALRELGTHKTASNPEALGYMLRGFFETLRRHVAFERDHLRQFIEEPPRLQ